METKLLLELLKMELDKNKGDGIQQSSKKKSNNSLIEVGKSYLFRTVTHIELGEVDTIDGDLVKIINASWIPDTGRYHDALKNGIESQLNSEIEPYPEFSIINLGSLINISPYNHPLPTEQK